MDFPQPSWRSGTSIPQGDRRRPASPGPSPRWPPWGGRRERFACDRSAPRGEEGTPGEGGESGGRYAVGDEDEVVFRCLVHPVAVLEGHDLRPYLTGPKGEAPGGVEDSFAALLGIHSGHGRVAGFHGEEEAQVGEDRPEVLAQEEDAPLHLLDDCCFSVPLLDPEVPFQEVDKGVEGHGEKLKLALPADEGRQAALGLHLQARSRYARGDHLPRSDGMLLPFHG